MSLVSEESKVATMRALVKNTLDRDGFTLEGNVEVPGAASHEVRIKVVSTAVCGTDKSIYHSSKSEGIRREMRRYLDSSTSFQPIVVGHEFCGIVDYVGSSVGAERFKDVPVEHRIEVGDYVTAEMHLSCGHCFQCRTGCQHICTRVKVKGVHLDGCFGEYVTVPYENVILLGKGGDTSLIPTRVGAMLDAFGNAVHTVYEADVRGKSVAILGAGPLGLMAAFLCKEFGASRIYLTEAADIERRFALGTEFGADYCFDVSGGSKQFYQSVRKLESMANGVDVVLEMSGSPSAYRDAFEIVRNGGTVLLLGITRQPLDGFDIANGVIWKGVTVKGIFGRKMFDTWETMLRLLHTESLDVKAKLEKVVAAGSYKLDQYEEAFEVLGNGQELKLIFEP
ncbi:MAG: alcohol dehydrogenase catalytic domain-containing protein [Candidatus Obscuribacterales bacterium]|nr:alcohol dehydrogenase catalytic domain-containing protein [Candidatus Obscuribacterales bacterium]